MFARLGASSLFLGGFGSVAYVSTIIDIDTTDSPSLTKEPTKQQKLPSFPKKDKDVTLEDVALFEKSKGCKLVFADKSGKSFTPLQWFEEKKKKQPQYEKHWKDQVTYGVWWQKHHCKKGEYLTLELIDEVHGSFKVKSKY